MGALAPQTNLAAALVAAQSEMPAVDKDGTNPHFRNTFVTLDNLIAKTRPVLNRHGLAIAQFPTVAETGQPTLTTRISHDAGESLEYVMPLFIGKQDMQAFGSAITYARRYAWAAALGISSDDEDDGNQAVATAEPPANQVTQPPAALAAISAAQRTRLFAIARSKNLTDAVIKQLVKDHGGVDSSSDIPKAKYDAVIAAIEAEGIEF